MTADLTSSPDKSGEITARLEAVGEPEHGSWIVALEEKNLPSYFDSWEVFNSDADYEPLLSGIRDESLAEFIAHAPEDIRYLLGLRNAVLALHQPIEAINTRFSPARPSRVCSGCGQDDGNWSLWPCATVKALGVTT